MLSADGERAGEVDHVMYEPGGLHFVDAPQVAEIREDAVILTVRSADIERLPNPGPSPAVIEHHGVEDSDSPLAHKLRRAWDVISGRG